MVLCKCKDCLDYFYDRKGERYTDEHGLHHHPKCNHITQEDFDKIEFEDEVWVDDLGIYVTKMVTFWSGYRCNCEKIYKELDEAMEEE